MEAMEIVKEEVEEMRVGGRPRRWMPETQNGGGGVGSPSVAETADPWLHRDARLPFSRGVRRLFPLPVHVQPRRDRRVGRGQQLPSREIVVEDGLRALNWLAGHREPQQSSPFWRPTENCMQDECVARVFALTDQMYGENAVGVPSSTNALAKVLKGTSVYDGSGGATTVASLDVGKLSLPADVSHARGLLDLLDESTQTYLREPERMVRSEIDEMDILASYTLL